MKKKSFISLLLISLALFSSCRKEEEKAQDNDRLVLFMAEVNPAVTISGLMDRAFKAKVAELSQEKIIINIQYDGILGNQNQILEEMIAGKSLVDIVRISPNDLAEFGCEKCGLFGVPYLFENTEHFWKFANSSLAYQFLKEPYEMNIGVRGLFFGEEGFRNFFSSKKLSSIKDLEGRKLRVTNDATMQKVATELKAQVKSVDFTEMPAKFKDGTIDAAEQPVINYLENSFYEVAPYMILDEHVLGVTEVVISSQAWNSLTKSQREILLQAGRYAGEYCKLISKELENEAIQTLTSKGVSIVSVDDNTPWKEACKNAIEELTTKFSSEYKQILDFAKD
ncbi:MAG: TRAP transporter substrate-binding protein [Treponema sp.]|nr:TRAP transporter substrate-binding protein [Treponema sp.]